MNSGDFILYNKTNKHEIDGMAFHKAESEQSKRDELKNSILAKPTSLSSALQPTEAMR